VATAAALVVPGARQPPPSLVQRDHIHTGRGIRLGQGILGLQSAGLGLQRQQVGRRTCCVAHLGQGGGPATLPGGFQQIPQALLGLAVGGQGALGFRHRQQHHLLVTSLGTLAARLGLALPGLDTSQVQGRPADA